MFKFLSCFGRGRRSRPKKIWLCNDVWLDIFPFFGRPQLGLQLALLSFRFDALVHKHFNVTPQLPIWRTIRIHKDSATEAAKLSVFFGNVPKHFPVPEHTLPNKIRFQQFCIEYIDHSVIKFLNANKQIFDKVNYFCLELSDEKHIWELVTREIWTIFVPSNIRRLDFLCDGLLNRLRHLISPTILFDIPLLNLIYSDNLLPDAIADDGPNATAGQALSKWLHTPTTDGRPKRLMCYEFIESRTREWLHNFKEAFLRSTTSVCYAIQLNLSSKMSIEPFDLMNERTKEQLTLTLKRKLHRHPNFDLWMMKRCPIGETIPLKAENPDDFSVLLLLYDKGIGPLSPPSKQHKSHLLRLCPFVRRHKNESFEN